jgi:hypothetical protein
MKLLTMIGFGWFVLWYIASAVLLVHAERALDATAKLSLVQLRRPLRPLPFLFAAVVFGLLAFCPSYLPFFLIVAGLLVISFANWRLRKGTLPRAFTASFAIATTLLWVGLAGLAFAFWFASGNAL